MRSFIAMMNGQLLQISPLIAATLFVVLGCGGEQLSTETERKFDYLCTGEQTKQEDGITYFQSHQHSFTNGQTQSDEAAFTGSFSSKTDATYPYGMGYTFKHLKPGDIIEAEVWRKDDSENGVLCIQAAWGYYQQTKKVVDTKDGWEKLVLRTVIRGNIDSGQVKVFTWMPEADQVAFFDDLSINVTTDSDYPHPEIPDTIPTLNLTVDDASMQQLQALRTRALQRGLIVSESDSWVEATLDENDRYYDAKIRFKGDWTDHILGKKWSFRIKLKEDSLLYRGMRVFSIQRPESRQFLKEWLLHQILLDEGLLTTRYDFAFVKLNGKHLGIYALEEHFSKELMTSNQREEGILLKFEEDALWQLRLNNDLKYDSEGSVPIMLASDLGVFSEKHIHKTPHLLAQLDTAKNLLYQYQFGQGMSSEVFDADKTARFLAIMDVMRSYHGMIWHNQRFYFNPSTNQLELVGYDGHSHGGGIQFSASPFVGYNDQHNHPHLHYLLHDEKVYQLYLNYLQHYSSEDFLNAFFNKYNNAIKTYEKQLRIEYDYLYSDTIVRNNAKVIRNTFLFTTEETMMARKKQEATYAIPAQTRAHYRKRSHPISGISIKGYAEKITKGQHYVTVHNFHHKAIEVVGYEKKGIAKMLDTPISISAYNYEGFPSEGMVTLKKSPEQVIYKVEGFDSLFTIEPIKGKAPKGL